MSEPFDGTDRRKTDQREVLLTAASGLQGGMAELSEQLARVAAYTQHTRKITKQIKVMIAALAVMLVLLAITTIRANNANDKADRLQQYDVATCQAGNQLRADSKGLFDDIGLLLGPGAKKDPALKAFNAALAEKVAQAYTPRDCSQASGGEAK